MTWSALYHAARSRAERTQIIRLHRAAWYYECGCWPSQYEQAAQLRCKQMTVSNALRGKFKTVAY